ncbi:MAG: DinB family protein [Syntrophobacteraceae bacterium]
MSGRSKKLADRLNSLNDEVISFVENCTEDDWNRIGAEGWPLGVTARHIGANHYPAISAAKMILSGEKLPEMTMEQITAFANRHAKEHAPCTKSEVLDVLRTQGRKLVEFAGGLEDSELDKTGYLPALGINMTVEQYIETVVLRSGREHFENIKAAAGK